MQTHDLINEIMLLRSVHLNQYWVRFDSWIWLCKSDPFRQIDWFCLWRDVRCLVIVCTYSQWTYFDIGRSWNMQYSVEMQRTETVKPPVNAEYMWNVFSWQACWAIDALSRQQVWETVSDVHLNHFLFLFYFLFFKLVNLFESMKTVQYGLPALNQLDRNPLSSI